MLCIHLHIYCLQLMHKQESFKCETDRKRTHFLWRRPVKFGSSHNKIFILSSSRAFYSGEINRWSPENLLACGGFFCQVVKRECGWFYSRHDHLHPGGGSVFQASVMLSGAHPSCCPWIPHLLHTDVPPHFILCILTWFSHICGFFLIVIISLSGGGKLWRSAAYFI